MFPQDALINFLYLHHGGCQITIEFIVMLLLESAIISSNTLNSMLAVQLQLIIELLQLAL